MKKYEALFILDIRKVEDEGKAFSEEIAKLVKDQGGTLGEMVPMGRRQFAREMKHRKAGIYLNCFFSMPGDKVNLIRHNYRLDERILRMMIINDERPANLPSAAATAAMVL